MKNILLTFMVLVSFEAIAYAKKDFPKNPVSKEYKFICKSNPKGDSHTFIARPKHYGSYKFDAGWVNYEDKAKSSEDNENIYFIVTNPDGIDFYHEVNKSELIATAYNVETGEIAYTLSCSSK